MWCPVSVKPELAASRMWLSRRIGRQVFAAAPSDQSKEPARHQQRKMRETLANDGNRAGVCLRWDRGQGPAPDPRSAMCPADGHSKYEG